MADIELYVDKFATMQIHNMNVWVDTAREEIISKYHPAEEDSTMHTLKSAHIIEETYFSHLIHADIDTTVTELRDKHSSDITSAPEQPVTADIKKQLKKVAEFEGSDVDKLLMIFCQQTHLNYSRLTEEEKAWLIKITNKSNLLRKGASRRAFFDGKESYNSANYVTLYKDYICVAYGRSRVQIFKLVNTIK
mgnify:CR=1 FL=1